MLYALAMTQVVRYPEATMEFAPKYDEPIPEQWQRFFDLREELLLDYGYNTARAYWADLQDWFEWAVGRDKDVLRLSEKNVKQYCALLRRRKYSDSTVRRRVGLLRRLQYASMQDRRDETTVSTGPAAY